MPSSATSFRPLLSAPSPGQLRGHIGDLPIHVLERILVDNLLEDGGLDTVKKFVVAAPTFASKAVRNVPHLFTICGVDEMGFKKDWWFWRKFSKLRRCQSKKGLWKAGDTGNSREEAQVQGERAMETQESGGIANWRKDNPAAHGTDEAL